MGTDIDIYRGSSLDSRIRYAQTIAAARGLLPAGINDAPQALLIFEQASALGIPPITGLAQIHIIKGKPTLSAGLMSGLIRQAGHKLRVWVEGEGDQMKAIAELIRSDDPDFTFHAEFTIADARQAGLYPGKDDSNWRKYPRPMLKSRVTSEIAREGATDVFLGAVYTPEELDSSIQVDDHGEMIATPSNSGGGGEQRTNLTSETTTSSNITAPDVPLDIRRQWFEAADGLKTHKAIKAMFEDVRAKGLLHITLADDPENPDDIELGAYLIQMGKAAGEREGVPAPGTAAAAAEQTGADEQTGEVVDAEIVDEGEPEPEDEGRAAVLDEPEPAPAAPAKPRTTRRSPRAANAAETGAQQG